MAAAVVFRGGRVWTGVPGDAPVSAVAVEAGRIVAVGEDALPLVGRRTQVVDLAGRTLLPGFRDGHLHPTGGAETLDCDLVDAADVDDVLARVSAYVAANPHDDWVLGYGYPPEILPRGVGLAAQLDAVVADRPVALWSSDHHMAWVNSRALRLAGIGPTTPDPPRGTIVRSSDGEPVGTLLEDAIDRLHAVVPARSLDREVRGLGVGLGRMTAAGIVWGQDAWLAPKLVPAYLQLARDGGLTADIDIALKVDVDGWRDQIDTFRDARTDVDRFGRDRAETPGGRLSATTVKFFADGVIEGGTGALLDDYCDAPGSRGILNWQPDELAAAAAAFDRHGFQLHFHAIGDAGVRAALDAIERVAAANGPGDRRPVVAHTHVVHPDDLPRFATLGVVANFEPLWAQPNRIMVELTEPRLGRRRSGWQYPIAALARSGAHVSFGSDWPVSSLVPMEGIAVAVTRQTPDGQPAGGWLPDQRVTLDEALTAYTAGTAYQAFDDHDAGRIQPGMRADLVVLGADVSEVSGLDLAGVPVDSVWLRGQRAT